MKKNITTCSQFIDYIAHYDEKTAYRYLSNNEIKDKTYRELVNRSKSIASYFKKKGYRNRNIAILGATSCEWLETYFGILLSGNVVVPLDRMLPMEDIGNLLRMGDVKSVFLSGEFAENVEEYRNMAEGVEEYISFTSKEYRNIQKTEHEVLDPVEKEQLAELIFTSGTTGVSKGVMLTHGNILSNVIGTNQFGFGRGNRQITLSVLPIHHTFELTVNNLAVLYIGGCVCINDKLENILANMQLFQPTHMLVVPMMAEMFYRKLQEGLKDPRKAKEFEMGLSICKTLEKAGIYSRTRVFRSVFNNFGGRLRYLIVGGAALSDEVTTGLEQIGLKVFQGYGLTECAPVVSVNSEVLGNRLGSVGQLMPRTKVRIQNGEIQISGPSVMKGYYKNKEATDEVFTDDGWLMTGDLGHVDKDGFLFITGRKKNLIILDNGKNIYPEELEQHIYAIEGVKDAMVYSAKGRICVVIQLQPNSDRSEVKKHIKELNANLPTYKKIHGVSFRNRDFPKTTTMKIKRSETLQEIENGVEEKREYIAPRNQMEKRICLSFERVLGKAPIGIKDDFFENGGDSLGALEVAAVLGIQAQEIYDYSTAEKLAKNMETPHTQYEERYANINGLIKSGISAKTGRPSYVLLTGATGYLGSHILVELLKHHVKVVCLVRDPEKLKSVLAYYFPKKYQELHYGVVLGNIEEESLGIETEKYQKLLDTVDAVVHVAANVHHTGHYEDFERTNVKGTENVIRFCEEGGAVLHHTSTASVSGAGTVKQENPNIIFTEKLLDIGQSYEQNVYIHSKYKAEEKVILARQRGVNANIYRIGNLTWRHKDGMFQKNAADNGFVSRCRGLIKVGAYYEELDVFPIDFTPVDLCADAYVRLVLCGDTNQIYHMINPNMYLIRELKRKMKVQQVSKRQFEKRLMDCMPDKDVAVLSFYCMIAQSSENIVINSDRTVKRLKELHFKWPKITLWYLRYMLKL